MATLHITRGLPASGKSTFARTWVAEDPAHRARINRDDLRAMMHAGVWLGPATESQILTVRNFAISALLWKGFDVICDDTNLPQGTARELAEIAQANHADWIVHDLTGIPVDECVRRDALRPTPIGETVIREMHQKYLAGRSLQPIQLRPEIHP